MIISLIFAFIASAFAADLNVPLATVYSRASDEIVAALCKDGSSYRQCRFQGASQCQTSALLSYNACYQTDLAKRNSVDVPTSEARVIVDSLLDCTSRSLRAPGDAKCFAATNASTKIDSAYLSQYKSIDTPVATATPENASSHAGLEVRYPLHVRYALEPYHRLLDRVRARDKSICPSGEKLWMRCAEFALRDLPIDNAISFQSALEILDVAARQDFPAGTTIPVPLALMALDLEISIFEHADPAKFYLNTEPTYTNADVLEAKYERNRETAVIRTGLAKVKKSYDDLFQKAARLPAGQLKTTITHLRDRANRVFSRNWSL